MEYFKLNGIPYDVSIEPYMDQVEKNVIKTIFRRMCGKVPVIEFIGKIEHHMEFRKFILKLADDAEMFMLFRKEKKV